MKLLRMLSIGAAILLCICLVAPSSAEASSARKKHSQSHRSLEKKHSRSLSIGKKRKHERYEKSSSYRIKKGIKNRLALKKGKRRIWIDRDDDRDLWLQRARGNDSLIGQASWYGRDFHKKPTASGVDYDMYTFTAAHRTLPLGTIVKVTDQNNGKSVIVCVTDRGPYVHGRIIDLSYAAATQLDLRERGVGRVKLEVVGDVSGTPIKSDQAFFIKYKNSDDKTRIGPFKAFADATAMHEAVSKGHPEAEVVLENATNY